MASNTKLSEAKNAKNDEFYTQWADIEKEIQAYLDFNPDVFRGKTILCPCDDPEWSNFTKFFALRFMEYGIRKLISTSYAPESKRYKYGYQPTLFETDDPKFDKEKTQTKGKIFILDQSNINKDGKVNIDDLQWDYMEGDGDFRSKEVLKLRDEADIIITNPPFSLFREFFIWVIETQKKFVIIGNMNAITYKEIFPHIKENGIWLGATGNGKDMVFAVPKGAVVAEEDRKKAARLGYVGDFTRLGNSCWFTNLDHGRRHKPFPLMPTGDILKFSKHKELKGKTRFDKYDNYDAIEVPFTDAIPSDYKGVMGVPVSFLDKYCPEQFEILGMCENMDLYDLKTKVYTTGECRQAYLEKFGKKGTYDLNASGVLKNNKKYEKVYQRILIKRIEGKE